MSCTHNFEDFWGSGYDKCLDCGSTRRSRHNGVLTHLIDEDGQPYPNPAYLGLFTQEPSRVSITLILASGEVIENL
jgi:hypothetical protein